MLIQILKESIKGALFRALALKMRKFTVRAVPGHLSWAVLTIMPLLLVAVMLRKFVVGVSRPVKAARLLITAPIIIATSLSVILVRVIVIVGIAAVTILRLSVSLPVVIPASVASFIWILILSIIATISSFPVLFMIGLAARIARRCFFMLG